MKQKRGTISISLNFLITLIIALLVLSLAMVFIKKIYSGATKTKEDYYQRFENQIESLSCDIADRVCVGKRTKTIEGKSAVFTMRIVNIGVPYDYDSVSPNFHVVAKCDEDAVAGGVSADCTSITLSLAGDYFIQENEDTKLIIAINMEKGESGTHIFNTFVCTNNDLGELSEDLTNCPVSHQYLYGKEKLYVIVP